MKCSTGTKSLSLFGLGSVIGGGECFFLEMKASKEGENVSFWTRIIIGGGGCGHHFPSESTCGIPQLDALMVPSVAERAEKVG